MTLKLVLNVVLGAAILACIVGAGVLVLRDSRSPGGVEVILPSPTPVPTEDQPTAQIMVYVSGEVMRPGVYRLDSEHRVDDALKAAGGPTSDADLDRINLALRLKDEDQIHFPAIGSPDAGPSQRTGTSASAFRVS